MVAALDVFSSFELVVALMVEGAASGAVVDAESVADVVDMVLAVEVC